MKAIKTIDPHLQNFEFLPDSAFVRLPVTQGLFACSPATIWRGVKAGWVPEPYKLSARTTAWNVGDLRRSLASLKGGIADPSSSFSSSPIARKIPNSSASISLGGV